MAVSKRRVQKKFMFTINVENTFSEIHKKYNLFETNITDISKVHINTDISFHDELRKIHKCSVITVDMNGPSRCFWDHHPFSGSPVGCPIEYKPQKISRTFNSEISKDSFVVFESLPKNSPTECLHTTKATQQEYYETDGIFCSLNCALAFAIENQHNPLYSRSIGLLEKIFNETGSNSTLVPAPSWRQLNVYSGGTMTIEEFRKNFQRISYEFKGIHRLSFKPISFVYEEQYRL